ncbi:SCO family protein [Thalassovita taeanensis]|uniref:Protein SCO1/2 n=1 Tax=Thalassovita taeanensis TaxID=657014 RepID=A0A1H9JZ73_9RHOB|nr:SCO family protein [Thalassovita taeanensis]SEQ91825.1 protein SCO1/2 [Thalassovita taeanensis]
MKRLALVLGLAFGPHASPALAQVQGVMLDAPVPIPAFTLSDQAGQPFSAVDLADHWTLIMFGFNSCPDVCPFTLGNLEAAISETALRVSPDSLPRVVFVSVDPARDSDTVTDYARFFHPEFRGVTGTRDQLDALVAATDSFYRLLPPDASGYYEVQHSSAVSVIGPDGQLRAKLQPPFDPGATAEFLARLQISYRRKSNQ